MAREQWYKDDEPEAIGPDRHHDPIKQDDLPERRNECAGQEAENEQAPAEQQQATGPEPIDQRSDQR